MRKAGDLINEFLREGKLKDNRSDPIGSGAYGVAAASLEYFDKSIKELNYAEAALLAALPKAPSKYNPYRNIELAKFRRDLVLKNLLENEYITLKSFNELKLKNGFKGINCLIIQKPIIASSTVFDRCSITIIEV